MLIIISNVFSNINSTTQKSYFYWGKIMNKNTTSEKIPPKKNDQIHFFRLNRNTWKKDRCKEYFSLKSKNT